MTQQNLYIPDQTANKAILLLASSIDTVALKKHNFKICMIANMLIADELSMKIHCLESEAAA